MEDTKRRELAALGRKKVRFYSDIYTITGIVLSDRQNAEWTLGSCNCPFFFFVWNVRVA